MVIFYKLNHEFEQIFNSHNNNKGFHYTLCKNLEDKYYFLIEEVNNKSSIYYRSELFTMSEFFFDECDMLE